LEVTLLYSMIITALVVAASIGGLLLVRHWILAEDLKIQHDVADPLSQVVGMMFAILLGFMVGDAMNRYASTRAIVQQEAASLGDIFRLSDGLPQANKDRIRALCISYCEQMINDEWPRMRETHTTSTTAWNTYRKLWKELATLAPKEQGESNVQQIMLGCMVTMADNHRLRVQALSSGLPMVLWVVLIIGGVATIVFTYFFSANRLKMQVIMVSLVSLVLCLNVFLLASYDDPFSGDVHISPGAFETDLMTFKAEIDANETKGSN
jgi:Protein of unknown function (DUF4239)